MTDPDAVLNRIDDLLAGCAERGHDFEDGRSHDAMNWTPLGTNEPESPCVCTVQALCDFHAEQHTALKSRMFDMVNLTCTCGHLAVTFMGDATDDELEAKFQDHLEEARLPVDDDLQAHIEGNQQ